MLMQHFSFVKNAWQNEVNSSTKPHFMLQKINHSMAWSGPGTSGQWSLLSATGANVVDKQEIH